MRLDATYFDQPQHILAGVDLGSFVNVTSLNGAVERRIDMRFFKQDFGGEAGSLRLLQAGPRDVQLCQLGAKGQALFVVYLFRGMTGRSEFPESCLRLPRQLGLGLQCVQIGGRQRDVGFALSQCCLDAGAVQLCQQITRNDLVADVDEHGFDLARMFEAEL